MRSTFSLTFDEVADRIRTSLWFQHPIMCLRRQDGYRALGNFGLKKGNRFSPSAFYGTLARCFIAVKTTGPGCLDANDFGDYRPKDTNEIAFILAIQFHLESSDNEDLSQRNFWKTHGKELMFHDDVVAVAGGERMSALAELETQFYEHCEAIDFEDLIDLHMDVCRALKEKAQSHQGQSRA